MDGVLITHVSHVTIAPPRFFLGFKSQTSPNMSRHHVMRDQMSSALYVRSALVLPNFVDET